MVPWTFSCPGGTLGVVLKYPEARDAFSPVLPLESIFRGTLMLNQPSDISPLVVPLDPAMYLCSGDWDETL